MSFIQTNLGKYTVKKMCSALKFPRSTYYAALNHVPSKIVNDMSNILRFKSLIDGDKLIMKLIRQPIITMLTSVTLTIVHTREAKSN